MRKVKEFCNQWIEKFIDNYHLNLPILMDSFAEFYGEEHRDWINGIISKVDLKFLINDIAYLNALNKDKSDPVNQMFQSYFTLLYRIIRYKEKRKESGIKARINYCALEPPKSLRGGGYTYRNYKSFFEVPTAAVMYYNEQTNREEVVLSVYYVDNSTIIHELNHTISTPEEGEANIFPYDEIDELINELVALDITTIFEKKKGSFVSTKMKINKEYEHKFFLIRDFYTKFKELIKVCLVTRNIQVLEEGLGKKTLDTYFALVKKLYYKKNIQDNDRKKLQFLVLMMEEHLKRVEEHPSRLVKLESLGYRTRKIAI